MLRSLAAGTMLAVAFATWPHAAVGDAWTALHDAPAVRAPFDPTAYPSLDGLVVVAAFGLALAASLAAATRRIAIVVAAVAVGIGFPARLLDDVDALALGALALGAVLWVLLAPSLRSVRADGTRSRRRSHRARRGGDRRDGRRHPSEARIDWRGWDPFAGSGRTASLRYVWDATYEGIEFPARPTVVLRVRAPKRADTGVSRPSRPSRPTAGSRTSTRSTSAARGGRFPPTPSCRAGMRNRDSGFARS